MLVSSPASLSKSNLPDLNPIATDTGFITRNSSKMNASMFVQTLVSAVSSGNASYNQLAVGLGRRTGKPMSRQAMAERFESVACVEFLTKVHNALIESQIMSVESALSTSETKRIILEDSSIQAMPVANAETFPAHGNLHGPTAGVKFNLVFDILNLKTIKQGLHGATEQDKEIGKESVIDLRAGDLSIRDMGYFVLPELTYIESVGANWLTRLPLNTNAKLLNGTPIDKHLKKSKANTVDIKVVVGNKEQKQCRLVAIRATPEITRKRRTERKKNAQKLKKDPTQKSLTLDGWHIMLTSLSKGSFSAEDLAAIYRIRWAVEIQFRAWKQATDFEAAFNRKSREHHMQALSIAAMINHLLMMFIAKIFTSNISVEKLSFEKLADALRDHHIKATAVEDIIDFTVDRRHIQRDARRAQSSLVMGLSALA